MSYFRNSMSKNRNSYLSGNYKTNKNMHEFPKKTNNNLTFISYFKWFLSFYCNDGEISRFRIDFDFEE